MKKERMRGEIITIGDELITGKVCDLNSFFLSARISSFGFDIQAMSSVGDDPDRILEVLGQAVGRSDFVLVSGGLGPTDDDLTTRVAAQFLSRPLVLDQEFLELIRNSLSQRGLPWAESYRKMAYLPQGARLIDPDGDACGFFVQEGPVQVFFLPGIPGEVRKLVETKVLPLLLDMGQDRVVRQRIIKLFGIEEARIGEALSGVLSQTRDVSIGFYPNFPENHVALTVRADSEESALGVLEGIDAEIQARLGPYIVARDSDTLETVAGRLLRDRKQTVSVAESCTGGLICQRITSVSGASDYFERGLVTYSNRAKIDLLGVPSDVIRDKGAVSEETARQMARGVRASGGSDVGLATTGIAGPTGGTPAKPVGTVYVALDAEAGSRVERFQFTGSRAQIAAFTAETALLWLKRHLTDDTFLPGH